MLKLLRYFSVFLVLSNVPAFANSEKDLIQKNTSLKQIKNQRYKKEQELKQIKDLIMQIRKKAQTLATKNQGIEVQILQLNKNIDKINVKKNKIQKNLLKISTNLSGVLGAVQRISKTPENALFLYPGTPEKAVLSLAVLKNIIPQINIYKTKLEQQVQTLETLQGNLIKNTKIKERQIKNLKSNSLVLRLEIDKKKRLQQKTLVLSKKLQKKEQKILKDIKSIQKFLEKLEKERKRNKAKFRTEKPSSIKKFPRKGYIESPAIGRLVKKYRARTISGGRTNGITIRTKKNARVIAPFDGYVAYAGRYANSKKNVIILSHDGGYNTVLIGLKTLDVKAGGWLLTGEPMGLMPNKAPDLQIEIRYGTKPKNPLQWIKKNRIKR